MRFKKYLKRRSHFGMLEQNRGLGSPCCCKPEAELKLCSELSFVPWTLLWGTEPSLRLKDSNAIPTALHGPGLPTMLPITHGLEQRLTFPMRNACDALSAHCLVIAGLLAPCLRRRRNFSCSGHPSNNWPNAVALILAHSANSFNCGSCCSSILQSPVEAAALWCHHSCLTAHIYLSGRALLPLFWNMRISQVELH